MTCVRAVLFDLGGTLYEYERLEPGDRESLLELASGAGSRAEPQTVYQAYRTALKNVFYQYLPRPFYLHRDLFRDALLETAQRLGVEFSKELMEGYFASQRKRRERLFALREGVVQTLEELRSRGLCLGIVSNVDEDQLAFLVALGQLERYFHFILSSEKARSCKPDPAIFEQALRRAGCAPKEALFVGDSLQQDIAGAKRVGMRAVLLWHRTDRTPPDHGSKPDHVIQSIPQVLQLV